MAGFLLAAAGGALGAGSRYLIGIWMLRVLGPGFPWGTLAVNVIGALLMGVLIEVVASRFSLSRDMQIFLATGVLGGFTTFSAFALDFALLWQRQAYVLALGYATASFFLTIFAVFAGLYIARTVLQSP